MNFGVVDMITRISVLVNQETNHCCETPLLFTPNVVSSSCNWEFRNTYSD